MGFDEGDLADLKDTVEQFLEQDTDRIDDREYMHLYDTAERHYESASELMQEGRLQSAGYELEYAAAAVGVAEGTVANIEKDLHMDYQSFLGGDLF